MRGQVFNQSLVILQDSWFREIHKRVREGEGKNGIGEGRKRAESK